MDTNGKLISFRKIYQARFCRVESYGMMTTPEEYDETQSYLQPTSKGGEPLGVSCSWQHNASEGALRMRLTRREESDSTPNGIELFEKPAMALLYETEL